MRSSAAAEGTPAGDAAYLELPGGRRRFAIHHRPDGPPRARVLFAPPFAEEMNKSRRVVAQHARALAAAGVEVLRFDLEGCGDSPGDFGDTTWAGWVQDVIAAATWLRRGAHDPVPRWWWSLRAGSLLAADALRALPAAERPAGVIAWQPVVQGRLALAQFLRLLAAADALANRTAAADEAGGAVKAARRALAEGRSVPVAGYRLSPAVAAGFEAAAMEPWPAGVGLDWIELGALEAAPLPPAARGAVERLHAAGVDVRSTTASGPAFWQTVEVEEAPALLAVSARAIEARLAA
jgi:exosortase A-associated hydrolase 2